MSSEPVPGTFLAELDESARRELLTAGTTRPLTAGRNLFVEGGSSEHVEIIRSGFVKVITTMSGPEQLLAVRVPGDLVGELAAITGHERTATVTACGKVVATVLQAADFRAFLGRHPAAANLVTAMVGTRLRWANARRADYNAFPVPVRLARVLVDLGEACGTPVDGGLRIGVELTHHELAMLIGAGADAVQRALRRLRDDGVLETGYRSITIRDVVRLRHHHEL